MSPLGIVVLIVLIDLLGFSVVMPLLAPFAEQYGFREWQIGLLFAAYPLCQLIAGPILGRLSDRYGRRPLLIFSQAGTALSFLILGLSRNFTVMLLARMLDGASGGNILVAQAYVADVTTPENRAKGMGLIGMAFGLGFVFGPLLGGLLLGLPVAEGWRLRLPFLVAAGFSTLAWVMVLLRLPESRSSQAEVRERPRVLSWQGLSDTVRVPGIGQLVLLGFLSVLAFAALESTLSLFLERRMNWNARTASFVFAGLGFLSAMVQGGLIRRLVPKFGEPRLIVWGIAIVALGFAGVALVSGARAGRGALAGGTGSGSARTVHQWLAIADHSHERAGSRLRNALVGPDPGADAQLRDFQRALRPGFVRRSVLVRFCGLCRHGSAGAGVSAALDASSGRRPGCCRGRGPCRRNRFLGQVAVEEAADLVRVSVRITRHHVDHRVAMVDENLDGLDQSLGSAREQPVEEESAELACGRSRVRGDHIEEALGCRIAGGVPVRCEIPRRGPQSLGIGPNPLHDALINEKPGNLGWLGTAAIRRFQQDRQRPGS